MVSFLQGLGALGGGLLSGYETGASMADRRRKRQIEEAAYSDKTAGESALMKALTGSGAGALPQPQMAPGQPSQPMQQPAAPQVAGLQNAIYGQESGYGRNPATSPKGAMGGMQVMPATFQQFARPGENISDPAANKAVGDRILASYMQKYGDPARAAVAYFSGPGNVAPPGSPTPWKRDASDGRVSTSQYVQQVLGRMGGAPQGQGAPSQQIAMGGGDWRQFAQRIIQANPNLSPGAFMHALQAAQPFMSMESRQQLQEMGLGLREKALESRERMFGAGEARKAEEGKTKATQAERKMGIEEKKVSAQMERFKTQQQGINDRFAQRLKQAEDRLAYAKTKDEKARVLQELRQAEQDRRAAMANRVKAAAAGMDVKELKALEAEEQQTKREAEKRIDDLTKQARGDAGTPAARPSLDEIWGK